jgi:hypothetical protein
MSGLAVTTPTRGNRWATLAVQHARRLQQIKLDSHDVAPFMRECSLSRKPSKMATHPIAGYEKQNEATKLETGHER